MGVGLEPLDPLGIPLAGAVPLAVYAATVGLYRPTLAFPAVALLVVLASVIWARGTLRHPLGAASATAAAGGGGGGGKLSYDEAKELTDEATALMRQGDYEGALPLAERAYKSLHGSGDIYEAYAAYNAGKSLIELGDCKKGLKYLDASEAIQGSRSEIREARAQCG